MYLSTLFSYIKGKRGKGAYLKTWVSRCHTNYIASCLALQLVREIAYENIPQKRIFECCLKLDEHIANQIGKGLNLIEIVKDFPRLYPEFCLNGNELKIKNKEISRIVNDGTIDYFLSQNTDRYYDSSIFTDSGIKKLEDLIEKRRNVTKSNNDFRVKSLPLFWFIKSDIIQQILTSYPKNKWANRIRDLLGMAHLTGHIYNIQFKSNFATKPKKPTIIDSNFYVFFNTCERSRKWGISLDLYDFIPKSPEGINPAIPWPKAEYYKIGEITKKKRIPLSTWQIYYTTIMNNLKLKHPLVHQELIKLGYT